MPLYLNGGTADELINTDPFALTVGMLFDQQVPIEWAFRGPATMKDRLGHFDPTLLAAVPVDELVAVAMAKPAVHRYPAVMARRLHELAVFVTEHYDGKVDTMWTTARTGAELYRRLRELPGFGDEKAKIFVALLAKRFDVCPPGWKKAAGPFADARPRTVADSDSPESLARVRQWKLAQKAANKDKQGRPLKP